MPPARQDVTVSNLAFIETEFPRRKCYPQLFNACNVLHIHYKEEIAPLCIPNLSMPQSTGVSPIESEPLIKEAEPQQEGSNEYYPILLEAVPGLSGEPLEEDINYFSPTAPN